MTDKANEIQDMVSSLLFDVYENGTRCAKSEREEYARKIITLITDEAVEAVICWEEEGRHFTRADAVKAIRQLAVNDNSGE